ncbi:hypothetical protein BC826DRAFT_1052484 [Russula brevipes]|nr:hypothetical protein BC826DRAFT_1052484 [Russula brevipes]
MAPYQALRRQDGTASTSTAATPTEHVSHVPEIGGSEAAFIVLVIVLAVIVIAASTGIYLLLRYGEPTSADLVARRKYSIRRRGIRAHPLPGLPGSLGEKIGSLLRERELDPRRDGEAVDLYQQRHQQQRDGYLRVGAVPVSCHPVLTEPTTESTHKSRSASHVDPRSEPAVSFGREAPGALVQASVPTHEPEPDEEWFDADDTISGIADGIPDGSNGTVNPLGYFTSHPHRADSGTVRGSHPSEIFRSLWNWNS